MTERADTPTIEKERRVISKGGKGIHNRLGAPRCSAVEFNCIVG